MALELRHDLVDAGVVQFLNPPEVVQMFVDVLNAVIDRICTFL